MVDQNPLRARRHIHMARWLYSLSSQISGPAVRRTLPFNIGKNYSDTLDHFLRYTLHDKQQQENKKFIFTTCFSLGPNKYLSWGTTSYFVITFDINKYNCTEIILFSLWKKSYPHFSSINKLKIDIDILELQVQSCSLKLTLTLTLIILG